MKNRRPGGLALATVLICFLALTVILFAAATGSVSHLRLVSAAEDQEHAKNLAESAISTAIEEIARTGTLPTQDISVSIHGIDGEGRLTFNKGLEPRAYSTFNLNASASTPGTRDISVPGQTAHLVGIGRVGSARSSIECLYYRPPFPDGLISSGPVRASALKLYAVRQAETYEGGDPSDPGILLPEKQLPGNLFSNYSQGWQDKDVTVRLTENSDISGTLGSVGTISLDSSSVVGGELLPSSRSRPIPAMDIRQKLELLKPNAFPFTSSTLDEKWFVLSGSDLNVLGDLDLNGSALLVEGDLTVSGAVVGTGVILVDGDVRIDDGGSDVTAAEQTAIACTGNFTLSATSPEGNYFKGLVYCEGDFLAKDITVVGATVVNGKKTRGQTELQNVRFVQSPSAVNINLRAPESIEYFGGGIDDGDETNDSERHYAFSFLSVPKSDGKGFTVSGRGYYTNNHNGPDGASLHIDVPTRWNPSPTFTKQRNFSTEMGLRPEMTATEIRTDPGFKVFLDEVVDWVLNAPPGDDKSDRPFLEGELAPQLAEALEAQMHHTPDSYNLNLSLNNLLGELSGSSRVLLWRTLEDL